MSKKVFAIIAVVAMLAPQFINVVPAQAATIVDGGEYTCTGGCFANWPTTAVFLVQGTNLYAYASANVWRTYHPGQADFSTVQTVSAADLASYTVKGYVAPKVGTFVKAMQISFVGSGIDTRTVYLVGLNGVFHPVYLASVYKYWTGDNNWQNIYGLPDAFTTVVVPTIGSTLDSTTNAPEGMAAMSLTGDYGYVGAGNTFRAFSTQSALDANKFNKTMAAKLPVSLNTGTQITGAESGYVAFQKKETSALPVTGIMTASVASDTPATNTLPLAASNAPLFKVLLSNNSSSTATVTEMVFKRTLLGAVADFTGLYLYDESKLLTTTARTIASDTHEVTFAALNFTIPAGSSKYITLKGDVYSSATPGDVHAFQLKSVTSNLTTTGLPISGNYMTIGSVTLSGNNITDTSAPSNPAVGQANAVVANFNLSNSGSNTQTFEQITFTYSGTVARSEITNFQLTPLGESTILATAAGIESNDTFTMTLTTPYTLTSGQNRSFSLKADIAGKKAQTMKFYTDETYHTRVVDQFYGFPVTMTNGFDSSDAATLTLQGGALTMADLGPIAGTISTNQSDVVLTKFSMVADRAIEVKQLDVVLIGSAGMSDVTPGGSGMVGDLRIKDCDSGTTLMSKTISTTNCVAGASCDFGTAKDTANTWRLTDAWNLTASVKKNLCVTVDVGTSSHLTDDTTETLHADVWPVEETASTTYYFRDVATGDYINQSDVVPASITGDTMTISSASLTTAAASTPVSHTAVKGAVNDSALGVSFTAGDGSDVTIRQIGVRVHVANTANTFLTANEDTTPNGEVIKVGLYDGATLLGEKTITNTTAAAFDYGLATFSNLTLNVTKSTTKTLSVKLDYSSSIAATKYIAASVYGTNVTAYDKDGNALTVSSDVNAVDGSNYPGGGSLANARIVTVTTAGSLTMALDANTPDTGIVLANTNDVIISKIKFIATNEAWTINKLRVKLNTAANDASVSSVKITYPEGTATGTLSSGYVNFTGLGWAIPANTSETVTISANLKAIGTDANETGREIKLGIDYDNGFEAVGASMTTDTEIDYGADLFGNAMYLRMTKPTVTVNSGSGTLTNGSFEFTRTTIGADASGPVTLKKLSWVINVTDAAAADLDVTTWRLYDSTNMSSPIAGVWGNGSTTSSAGTIAVVASTNPNYLIFVPDTEREIGAGSSRTYVLKGTVSDAQTAGDSVTVGLYSTNDTALLTGGLSYSAAEIRQIDDGSTQTKADFIWSDKAEGINHTDTIQSTYVDFSNGYLLNLPTETRSYTWPS